jgi:hypothetical protein
LGEESFAFTAAALRFLGKMKGGTRDAGGWEELL